MTHHAHLLIGSKEWAFSCLPPEYTKDSQDIRILDYEDKMTISDARALIKEAHLKAVSEKSHVFVIITDKILREAQNALLKLFEDPNPDTIFYLILPKEDFLLPTLKSRLHLVGREEKEISTKVFDEFLKLSYAERLSFIEEQIKSGDVNWMNAIVSGFEDYAQKSKLVSLMNTALMVVRYFDNKGASKKMLLEHIALTL